MTEGVKKRRSNRLVEMESDRMLKQQEGERWRDR